MLTETLFALPESMRHEEVVLATYLIELDAGADVLAKASQFAVGQTIGTWTEVPGVTDAMRRHHLGRVVSILQAPAADLSTQVSGMLSYFIQVALPTVNFGAQFPQLMTTLTGNDASTSIQAKLVELQMSDSFTSRFAGPQFGISGVRALVDVSDRPLILNMIKPCTGLTPEQGARIFFDTALGGVDLIKDDELLGNTSFSPVVERVKAYEEAADRAAQITGKRTIYVPNVTDRPERLLETADAAVAAGAKAVMVSFAAVGYGMVEALARRVGVPILGHYAGAGMSYEGIMSGMSARIALGQLPRLAGADMVMLNTPYGGYPMQRTSFIMTAQQLRLPRPAVRPALPMVGGAVHPGVVELYISELGHDIVLSPGGAVQGHPDGPTAGARAVRQAVDAAMAGVPPTEYATDHQELAVALDQWGYHSPGSPDAR